MQAKRSCNSGVIPLKNLETGKKSKSCRYFKAKVLETHFSLETNETIKDSIDNQSIVFTDKSTSYVDISDLVGKMQNYRHYLEQLL